MCSIYAGIQLKQGHDGDIRRNMKHKGLMFMSSNVNCSLNNLVNKVFDRY